MMLTPLEPKAGPTGGAGVAFPASRANFIIPVTDQKKMQPISKNIQTPNLKSKVKIIPFFALPPPGLGGAMEMTVRALGA